MKGKKEKKSSIMYPCTMKFFAIHNESKSEKQRSYFESEP